MLSLKHHQKYRRIVPLGLLLFSLVTFFFLYQHTRNQRLKDIELLNEQQQQQEQAQRLENERLEKEKQDRLQFIESRITVHEPVLNQTDEKWLPLQHTHDIAFPTLLPPWTDLDHQLLEMSLGETIRADLLTIGETMIDFKQMTSQLRVFKTLYQYFDPLRAAEKDFTGELKASWSLYTDLEQQLYSWIKPYRKDVFAINSANATTTTKRGIVMCVGDDQFHFAIRTIQAIRDIFKSDLPIEIFAIDDDDLSPLKRQALVKKFDHISVHNIVDRINPEGTDFGGWSLKPFAVLASRFDEVILMDADVYFFQSPNTLFDDAGYQATGTLFFYDRTLFGDWTLGRHWLESFLPSTSSLVPTLRWWKYQSAHEQESGVVVINKRRSLMGLLATCKINAKRERNEVSYKHIHGDKETFWIGYEMVQTPYAFVKTHGGVLGGLGDGGDPARVCGNILHLDAKQKPYWWNGGLLRDKNKWPDRYLLFTHYAQGEHWDFETSCIKETNQIYEFNSKDKETARLFMKYDKELKKFDDIQ